MKAELRVLLVILFTIHVREPQCGQNHKDRNVDKVYFLIAVPC